MLALIPEVLYLSFIVTLTTFITRATFRRISKKKWGGSDVYTHLYLIDLIRKNDHKPPRDIPKYLTSGFLGYPIFIHWLLSFLDKDTVQKTEPIWGALIDSLQNLFLFLSVTFLFAEHLHVNHCRYLALSASLIFAFTPMLVKQDARIFSLSARPFGGLLFSVVTAFMLQFYWTNNTWWLAGALSIVPFIFLSSKFAVQTLIFFYVAFTLSLGSLWFILVVLAGLLLAIIISLGYYLRVMKCHTGHLLFYARYLQSKRPELMTSPSVIHVLRNVSSLKNRPLDFFRMVYRNPTLRMVTYTPFLLLWALVLVQKKIYTNETLCILSIWIVIPIVACLLFSVKHLRFLGEPDRYMEYSIFPLSIVSAYSLLKYQEYLPIGIFLLGFGIAVILVNYWAGLTFGSVSTELEEELIEHLRAKPKALNILTIPNQLSKKIAYLTKHNVLSFCGNLASTPQSIEEFKFLFPEAYPMITTDLKPVIKTYGIDMIVVNKEAITRMGYECKYDFSSFVKALENRMYVVYSVA